MLSFLSDLPSSFYLGSRSSIELSVSTLVLTFLLELFSLETSRKVLEQSGSLYTTAVAVNFRNHFVFGLPVYTTAVVLFCKGNDEKNWMQRVLSILACILIHSILYYSAHRLMHTPQFYRHHKFHHQFAVHVPPVSANAVTVVEYLVAYVVPFAVAALIARPDELSLRISVYIVSFANLLIHTPKLEKLSERLPPTFVSTNGHLEHHRKLNMNYAAPTINVDWFVDHVTVSVKKVA